MPVCYCSPTRMKRYAMTTHVTMRLTLRSELGRMGHSLVSLTVGLIFFEDLCTEKRVEAGITTLCAAFHETKET